MKPASICAIVLAGALAMPALAFAAPDLQLINVTVYPMTTAGGQKVTITYMPQNDGNMDTGAFKVGFYFSNDIAITTSDTLLREIDFTGIPANTNFGSMEAEVTIPTGAPLGMRYVGVMMDLANAVVENDESDNARAASLTIDDPPDLRVSLMTVNPATALPGDQVEITYSLVNAGDVPSGPFNTRLYFSEDVIISSDDVALEHVRETTLAAGATSGQIIVYQTIPYQAPPGTRYVGAIADSDGAVWEGDELNNTRAAAITIQAMTCFDVPSSSPEVCGGRGVCVAPDSCECDDGWLGEECENPLLADDYIADEGPADIFVGDFGQVDAVSDEGAADSGIDQDVSADAGRDEGGVADTSVAVDAGTDTTADGGETGNGGCVQSGGSGLPAALILLVAAACFAFRRKFV